MKRSAWVLGALVACAWATPALASGDYCRPSWRPENPDLDCTSQIAISPGNDSRVNLYLLLLDQADLDGSGRDYPDLEWYTFYGRNFFRWQNLREAWFPLPPLDEDAGGDGWSIYGGDRCQTLETGRAAFLAALDGASGLKPADRELLATSRTRVDESCAEGPGSVKLPDGGNYFVSIGANGIGDASMGFMTYLEASASFYGGEWGRAGEYYAKLSDGGTDPWLTETANYMVARTALNEAIESGDDEWGWFDTEKANRAAAKRSEDQFRAYLAKYPEGRYASSARGLIRKTLWLQGEYGKLGAIYGELLQDADPTAEQTARLVEELDDKYLTRSDEPALDSALLLAADNLMRMRTWQYDEAQREYGARGITAEELAAQAPAFAEHPELYAFLKANHAFYVTKDYRAVRDLLPDDARQESYTPLAFSRQYLRGLALHALKDPNEEGFWLELIGGAKGMWQRPSVELALARLWEQQGRVDKVFAEGSPITDSRIRRMLLGNSAGPEILKRQLRSTTAPQPERAFALFTALLRQLQYGQYAGFGEDFPFAAQFPLPGENEYGLWNVIDDVNPPLNLFTAGEWSDGYPCPSIDKTAAALARNPKDVNGRLCLGDFYRLNGFDDFRFEYRWDDETEGLPPALGESDNYPGKATPRHDFYTAIMADRTATKDQRAYALYRAIRCYAPANTNTCGGGDGVAKSQREAWFNTLKRDYGTTQWAKELRYFW